MFSYHQLADTKIHRPIMYLKEIIQTNLGIRRQNKVGCFRSMENNLTYVYIVLLNAGSPRNRYTQFVATLTSISDHKISKSGD